LKDSDEFAKLATEFEMVNIEESLVPQDAQYTPTDGNYYPRIMYVDSEGKLRANIKDNTRYEAQYQFSTKAAVIRVMGYAKKVYAADVKKEEAAASSGTTEL
jgi:hypothetical protein